MNKTFTKLLTITILSSTLLSAPLITLNAQENNRTAGVESSKPLDESETYRQLNLFGDVFERVRSQYVEEVTDKELIEYAINGMLSALDPHSAYMNAESFTDMRVNTKGEFGGLGIEVTMENGFVKVVSPIDDTPAFHAGVEAGDYITHLDGEAVMGLNLSEAVDKMRGKVGTDIEITVRREGEAEPLFIKITRDVIKIKSVRHHVEDNDIGYIRITQFTQNTFTGLKTAIKAIKEETNGDLKGYVLDLRSNPGGLLNQAIAVSDAFLDSGEIVSTRGRNPKDTRRDNATAGDLTEGKPIIVLINGGSASASEIVSGALQDQGRAIIMGTQSFGKGSVQTVMPLSNEGAMRLTTARYYTPSGNSIQAKGIEPDIIVEQSKVEALKIRRTKEADLRGALDKKDDEKATKDGEEANEEENKLEDYQLVRAKDLLRALNLYDTTKDNKKN